MERKRRTKQNITQLFSNPDYYVSCQHSKCKSVTEKCSKCTRISELI